ncbi:MAG TPA: PEGA domain-containing protein [Polyangiaceae bacterium]|nr:PEGA domain-containing protein [Polyangiaceae bacterium]
MMLADCPRLRRLATLVLLTLSQSSLARAQAAPSQAPEELRQQAKASYDQGVVAYNAGRFLEAVELFLAADRTLPSAALSFNVARAYEQLKMTALALRFYRDYLRREAGPANANTEAATLRIAALERVLIESGVQQLTVLSVPAGASLTIDGKALGATPWTGELTPGPHQLALASTGYEETLRQFELPAAHALELRVPLGPRSGAPAAPQPSSTTSPPTRPLAVPPASEPARAKGFGPWPFVALGAGGAALLVAGGFELSRRSAESDAETPGLPQIAYRDRLDAVHSRATTARAFAAVGGVLSVTGGVLVFLDPARRGSQRQSAALACAPSSCFGSFSLRY